MRPAIYVDMDGVLTDFVGKVADVFGISKEQLEFDLWNYKTYSIPEVLDMTPNEFWSKIKEQGIWFWDTMARYDWADDLLRECNIKDAQIYICSSPGYMPQAAYGKLLWMQRNLHPGFRNFVLTGQKHLLAREDRITILIDDSRDNVSKFERYGGKAILFPQPWNTFEELPSREERLPFVKQQLIKLLEDVNTEETTSK